MIIKDNYITVIVSRESRADYGIAQHETVFPFCSGDDLQITEASKAANKLQAKLEQFNVESTLAVYAPIAELPGVPSILDVDAARETKQRRVRAAMGKRRFRSSSSIGCRAGRIGAGA